MFVCKKIFSFVTRMVACLYVIIFLPIAPFVAPLGLLATAYSNMTTIGAILCLLGTSAIPLTMPISSYFICIRLSEKKYIPVLFYCILPFLCAVAAFFWFIFIVYLHDFFFG